MKTAKKTKKQVKKPSQGFVARHRLSLLTAAIALVVVIGATLVFGLQSYHGKTHRLTFDDAHPVTSASLRDTLQSIMGPSLGSKVFTLWKLQGGNAETLRGSYAITPGISALRLSNRLARGKQSPVKVTFNNVRTLDELATRVTAKLGLTPEDFLAACDTVLAPRGYSREQYVAAFLPDTYEFYYTVSPIDLVNNLTAVRNRFWNQERTIKADALGLTPAQVHTLASIVEEETAMADERPRVARLYLNRLSRKMKLQADPTVKFAIGDFSIKRITTPMLSTVSPYNTYQVNGLPPGPIRLVERATIDAVLDAPKHDYLYMCAKEDFSGYHNFATDYATHQANARRYQAELDRREIK